MIAIGANIGVASVRSRHSTPCLLTEVYNDILSINAVELVASMIDYESRIGNYRWYQTTKFSPRQATALCVCFVEAKQ